MGKVLGSTPEHAARAAAILLLIVVSLSAACTVGETRHPDGSATASVDSPSLSPSPSPSGWQHAQALSLAMFNAWKDGRRDRARSIASADAVQNLFSEPWNRRVQPPTECSRAPDRALECSGVGPTTVLFIVSKRPTGGEWVVAVEIGSCTGDSGQSGTCYFLQP